MDKQELQMDIILKQLLKTLDTSDGTSQQNVSMQLEMKYVILIRVLQDVVQ